MADHISNSLHIKGDVDLIKKIRQTIVSKKLDDFGHCDLIDFNKIVSIPEELDVEIDYLGLKTYKIIYGKLSTPNLFLSTIMSKSVEEIKKTLNDWTPEMCEQGIDFARRYRNNIEKYGCITSYDYCVKNWGTKWNAYDFDHHRSDDNVIFFLTAWSAPLPVIEKLSQMFPTAEFTIMFAGDRTFNTGKVTFKNGEVLNSIFPEYRSELAFDFYCEMWGWVGADYQKWIETGEIDNDYW